MPFMGLFTFTHKGENKPNMNEAVDVRWEEYHGERVVGKGQKRSFTIVKLPQVDIATLESGAVTKIIRGAKGQHQGMWASMVSELILWRKRPSHGVEAGGRGGRRELCIVGGAEKGTTAAVDCLRERGACVDYGNLRTIQFISTFKF